MGLSVSVVMATYNRQMALERLLGDLSRQGLSPSAFEVVVVDDGSSPPVAGRLRNVAYPFHLELLHQENAGPAAARHLGVMAARGRIIVFVDDDMQVGPDFLAAHLAAHHEHGRAVILGTIRPPPSAERLPLFERFHLDSLNRMQADMRRDNKRAGGASLCTGNVSLRRDDYFAVGGFDPTLRESEDRDLGLRLERAGIPLFMCERASSMHASDHSDLSGWLDRSRRYGRSDLHIHRKNGKLRQSSPWRFLFLVSPLSRPVLLGACVAPGSARALSSALMAVASAVDGAGVESAALRLATLAYGVEYFAGLARASGSLGATLRGLSEEVESRMGAPRARELLATAELLERLRADADVLKRHQDHYRHVRPASRSAVRSAVEQIGQQMMVAIRVMRWLRDVGATQSAKVLARMIRHTYGAEIHWDAQFGPGVCIVHGTGLVVGHQARVDEGCILFQNVTLGESLHPDTRERGSPHLEANVHVGPGCTLLGPITVGAGSKVMAGSVLTRSVPPLSLVTPAPVVITPRVQPAAAPAATVLVLELQQVGASV